MARKTSPQALAHRIALVLSDRDRRAVITEAGDDCFFYSALLKRLGVNRRVDFFAAEGRRKVRAALVVLMDLGKGDRSYAIVDRDFNFSEPALSLDGHFLVIDVYSFENYFNNVETLIEVGERFFSLEPGGQELAEWGLLIENFLNSVPAALEHEHAIAHACRSKHIPCNLGNFRTTGSILISDSGALQRAATLSAKFMDDTGIESSLITADEIGISLSVLRHLEWPVFVRGHYYWELFVRLLNMYRGRIDRVRKANGQNRSRTRSEISERHAIEVSASLVPIPPVVDAFLRAAAA